MITLGSRAFGGPYLLPLWSAPRHGGLYAVMVPGWRLLTFRALHFGEAESFSMETIKASSRYPEWASVAGTDWNLYVATLELPLATRAEREAELREIVRAYRPGYSAPVPNPELPGLRTMLLARALRGDPQE